MTTISDVARLAGVSTKTVSRVLNNELHVRPVLRERVEAAVAALEYRPSLAARQLAGKKSFIIAYPFNNPSPSYVTDILMGAAVTCRDQGYHLVSEPVDLDGDILGVIERLISTLRPDGMLMTPPLCDMAEVVALVAALDVPLVRVAGGRQDYGRSILIDDHEAAQRMVAHLVQIGHRRIAHVRPPDTHLLANARTEGYFDGLRTAGIAIEPDYIIAGSFDVESGIEAARRLLALKVPPTAIFAANDDMALGVMYHARASGLAIPGDVAVAGFDDSQASKLAWPPLTTVRQPTVALGRSAATILLGQEPDMSELTHELVIRGSTQADLAT